MLFKLLRNHGPQEGLGSRPVQSEQGFGAFYTDISIKIGFCVFLCNNSCRKRFWNILLSNSYQNFVGFVSVGLVRLLQHILRKL